MTKPGHEAPLKDNKNPAGLNAEGPAGQLGLGSEVPAQVPGGGEVPPGLRLTQAEADRVKKLMDTEGLDRGTALKRTLSRSRANRIIMHDLVSAKIPGMAESVAARKATPLPSPHTEEQLKELLRNPPAPNQQPPKPKAA